MADPARPLTPEDTLAIISDKAREKGDSFTVRVQRRVSSSPTPQTVALLNGATAEQLAQPETWLTRLAGGGNYLLTIYHSDDRLRMLGGVLLVTVKGDGVEVDPTVVDTPDWVGPKVMLFPSLLPKPKEIQFLNVSGMPSGGTVGSAPRTDSDHGGPAAGRFHEQQLAAAQAQLTQARMELERERHKADLDLLKRAQDLEIAKLRTELTGSMARPQQTNATMELVQAFSPMLTKLIEVMGDSRKDKASASEDRLLALMTQMANKPAISPEVLALIAQRQDNSEATGKVFSQMAEATGSVVSMAMSAVQAMTEAQQGPEESTTLKVIREVVKGVAAVSQDAAQQRMMPNRALPPSPAGARTRRPPTTPRPSNPATPEAPAQVAHSPTESPETGAPANGFAGLEDDEASLNTTALEATIAMIKDLVPAPHVARFFISNIRDPSIQSSLEAHGWSPVEAFSPYLSAWVAEDETRAQYLADIIREAGRLGAATGMTTTDEEGADVEEETAELEPGATQVAAEA